MNEKDTKQTATAVETAPAAPALIPDTGKETQTPAQETNPDKTNLNGGGAEKNAASDENPDGGQKPGDGTEVKEETDPEKTQTQDEDPYGAFTLPEGVTVADTPMESFKSLAKEMNLTKEQAQKLVDIQAGMVAAQVQEIKQQQEKWKAEVKQEHGAREQEVLSRAAKTMDTYGGDELRAALDEMGIGNHPVLIRTFAKIGETISEDKTVSSKTQGGGDKTFAEALYGSN